MRRVHGDAAGRRAPGVTSVESVRKWFREAQVEAGERTEVTSSESEEIRRLKRENVELKRANAVKSG